MRRKVLIVAILIVAMLLQCVMPIMAVNATTSVVITLNRNLYKSVKKQLVEQGIVADYKDANYLIVISEEELAKVTKLDLSNSEIDDLSGGSTISSGLEAFKNLSELNLHANYLTVDSNLNVLDKFEHLSKVDLSSNQIESVKSISSFHDSNITYDITDQRITGRTIIQVDDSAESENRVKQAIVALPDILLENEGGFDPAWLYDRNGHLTREIASYTDPETGDTTSPEIDYESSFGTIDSVDANQYLDYTDGAVGPYPYVVINVADGNGADFHTLKGLIKFKIIVNDSSSKLKDTQITYYYAITDEEETGIAFDDGNCYKAVKNQLTKNQDLNNDPIVRETTDVRNVYSRPDTEDVNQTRLYDEALILVISNNDINNNIPTLILNDKRIEDLRGIEQFVGLETNLDISYNYIKTIKRIIELEQNKAIKEEAIRTKYNKFLNGSTDSEGNVIETGLIPSVTAYDTAISTIKTATESYYKAMREYAGIAETEVAARTAKMNEAQGYLDTITDAEIARDRAIALINKYTAKLYEVFEKEYRLVSLLPSNVNYLSYEDLLKASFGTVKGYASSIMTRVSNMEKKEALTDYETWAIKKLMKSWGESNGLEFKETKTVYSPNPTGGDPIEGTERIENPISEFFTEVQADTTLDTTDFEEFVYIFKCIDALSQVEQYSLIKRQFEGTTTNYVEEAVEDILKLYEEKGYDTHFYDLIVKDTVTNSPTYGKIIEGSLTADKTSINATTMGIELVGNEIYSVDIGLAQSQYTGNESSYCLKLAHRLSLITADDLTTYIILPRVQKLNMADNEIRSLEGIETLSELKQLNAWKNLVNDISNVDWGVFKKLTHLNLGYNQISDISKLQVLLDLVELNVSYNLLSGRFTFRVINMKNLEVADFSHNQYNDIGYANEQYILKALGYDANGDGVAEGYTVPEYLEATGIKLSFQFQTLEMSTTITKTDDEFVFLDLPLIFSQVEKMDNAKISYGVDSQGGSVIASGTQVKLKVPAIGTYTSTVSVEGRNGYSPLYYSTDGIGYGTICKIKYTVVDGSEISVIPTDPTNPTDSTDPTQPTNPVNPTQPAEINYGYPVANGYIYVYYPETTLEQFEARLVDLEQYKVSVSGNKTDKIGTGTIVTISSLDGQTDYEYLEVVVKGDLNGDGDVDAFDSGIIRNVICDTVVLAGVYESAADVNSDGDIDSQDSMLILKYRADRISSFED